MKKRFLILVFLAFLLTTISAYSMNGNYSSSGNGAVIQQINYPGGGRTVQTRYDNNSINSSLNSGQRHVGYNRTYGGRSTYPSVQYGYYNQPVYIPTTYTPVTTTRRYNIGGNGYSNVYTEQTTRYYGNPTIKTYPAGSGMNNPNRYLNW